MKNIKKGLCKQNKNKYLNSITDLNGKINNSKF